MFIHLLEVSNANASKILDVTIGNGSITLCKSFRHQTLEERDAIYAGELNLISEFDWDEPAGSEIW